MGGDPKLVPLQGGSWTGATATAAAWGSTTAKVQGGMGRDGEGTRMGKGRDGDRDGVRKGQEWDGEGLGKGQGWDGERMRMRWG